MMTVQTGEGNKLVINNVDSSGHRDRQKHQNSDEKNWMTPSGGVDGANDVLPNFDIHHRRFDNTTNQKQKQNGPDHAKQFDGEFSPKKKHQFNTT